MTAAIRTAELCREVHMPAYMLLVSMRLLAHSPGYDFEHCEVRKLLSLRLIGAFA